MDVWDGGREIREKMELNVTLFSILKNVVEKYAAIVGRFPSKWPPSFSILRRWECLLAEKI